MLFGAIFSDPQFKCEFMNTILQYKFLDKV